MEVMLKLLIPMTQPWFLLSATQTNSALSDEALHLLTAILSKVKWKKYISMLEYWMKKLGGAEQQKPIVRFVGKKL